MSEFQPNKETMSLEQLLRDTIDIYLQNGRMSWAELIGTLELIKADLLDMMLNGDADESEEGEGDTEAM